MLLLTAAVFPRLNERGSIEASIRVNAASTALAK